MHQETTADSAGELGLAPRKRGRPRKALTPEPPAITMPDILALVKELTTQQTQLMAQMAQSQQAQTEMFTAWMQLFIPQQQSPLPSTTPDERALKRAERDLGEWDPVDFKLDPFGSFM